MLGQRCDGGRHPLWSVPFLKISLHETRPVSKFLSRKLDKASIARKCNVYSVNVHFSCLLLLVRFPGEKFSLIPIPWRGKAKVQTLVEPILERKSRLGSSGSKFPSEEKFFLSGKEMCKCASYNVRTCRLVGLHVACTCSVACSRSFSLTCRVHI